MEIDQLNSQIKQTERISAIVEQKPALGAQYGGRAVLSGGAINTFLGGLKDYQIELKEPAGAIATIEQAGLQFVDGPPTAIVTASAIDKSHIVKVKLRVRADLEVSGSPDDSSLHIRLIARDVQPDVHVSIFRLRELWFVWGLMRMKADQLASSLPDITVPIEVDLPIDLDPSGSSDIQLGDATMHSSQNLPSVSLRYSVRVQNAITLHDGVHVFFTVARAR